MYEEKIMMGIFRFVKDVLKHFRSPSSPICSEYFPFSDKAANTIIKIIEDRAKKAKRKDEPHLTLQCP